MSFEPDKVTRAFIPLCDYYWPRFLFNANPINLWYNLPNPYDIEKQRKARTDLGHSYVNLFVEGWRASAYGAGHVLAAVFPFALMALIGAIVTSLS